MWSLIGKTIFLCFWTGESFMEWVKLPDGWVGVCKTEKRVVVLERTVCAKVHLTKCLVCLGNSKRAGWLESGLCGMEGQNPRLQGWKGPMSSSSLFSISSFSVSKPKCPWCSHPWLAQANGFNLFELKERRSRMETG